jgi:hypothetical protein
MFVILFRHPYFFFYRWNCCFVWNRISEFVHTFCFAFRQPDVTFWLSLYGYLLGAQNYCIYNTVQLYNRSVRHPHVVELKHSVISPLLFNNGKEEDVATKLSE